MRISGSDGPLTAGFAWLFVTKHRPLIRRDSLRGEKERLREKVREKSRQDLRQARDKAATQPQPLHIDDSYEYLSKCHPFWTKYSILGARESTLADLCAGVLRLLAKSRWHHHLDRPVALSGWTRTSCINRCPAAFLRSHSVLQNATMTVQSKCGAVLLR